MKMTQAEKSIMAKDLRELADKLDAGMVVKNITGGWEVIDSGHEEYYISSWDPSIEEGFKRMQVRPMELKYTFDIYCNPDMIETDDGPPKKKKKKKEKKNESKYKSANKTF